MGKLFIAAWFAALIMIAGVALAAVVFVIPNKLDDKYGWKIAASYCLTLIFFILTSLLWFLDSEGAL